MPEEKSSSRFRLVGTGPLTEGLKHKLEPEDILLIGRGEGAAVLVQVQRTPVLTMTGRLPRGNEERRATGNLTRLTSDRAHAMILETAKGWSLRDMSTNGTVVLPGGFPPAHRIERDLEEYVLQPDDVIELAGDGLMNFRWQRLSNAASAAEGVDSHKAAGSEPRTSRLIAVSERSLQVLSKGVALEALALDKAPIRIGGSPSPDGPQRQMELPPRYLQVPSAPELPALGEVSVIEGRAVLRTVRPGLRLNLKSLMPGSEAPLDDAALITIDDEPDTAILYLEPHQLKPRNLSDWLRDLTRITLGRAHGLHHPSVSRHHAEVWREGTDIFIRDLGSQNGTLVDGSRILDSRRLQAGGRFSLGLLPFTVDAACWESPKDKPRAIEVLVSRVTVKVPGKTLLQEISMTVGQGELVGVMGPSGGGKSVLFQLLAGKLRATGGQVFVNGRAMDGAGWNWLRSLMGVWEQEFGVGLVWQASLIPEELTVREILEYAGRQMGMEAPEASKAALAAAERCGLNEVIDRVARKNGKQLVSGGQLKRITIAIETLRRPRILLLDEPLSEQDPHTSDSLMKLFRTLANSGMTLLFSSHDTRTCVLCDKILVICQGHLVYYGPPGNLAPHFGKEDVAAVYATLVETSGSNGAAELVRRFRASPLYRQYCSVEDV